MKNFSYLFEIMYDFLRKEEDSTIERFTYEILIMRKKVPHSFGVYYKRFIVPNDLIECPYSKEFNNITKIRQQYEHKYKIDFDKFSYELEKYIFASDNRNSNLSSIIFEKVIAEVNFEIYRADSDEKISCDKILIKILDELPTNALRSIVKKLQSEKNEAAGRTGEDNFGSDFENDLNGGGNFRLSDEEYENALKHKFSDDGFDETDDTDETDEEDFDDIDDDTDDEDFDDIDDDTDDEEENEEVKSFLNDLMDDMEKSDPLFEAEKKGNFKKNNEYLCKLIDDSKKIHKQLTENIVGQEKAINTFMTGYFRSMLSRTIFVDRNSPEATFLFAGPPGVGKTFLAEQIAIALGRPFIRIDMSEYSDKESPIEFAGSDKVYKNGQEGNVTGFVAKNPNCVILFDEIEKSHLNIIHLFLQILDAGRLRDNFTDKELSFKDTIIIFTTNSGRRLYDDDSINPETVSQKVILQALSSEINPVTGSAMFPPAICSRFASGNVVMFNRMEAEHLVKISERELRKNCEAINKNTNMNIKLDEKIPYAILFSEGGRADARNIKSNSAKFINDELYELLMLIQTKYGTDEIMKLENISVKIDLPSNNEVYELFNRPSAAEILVFSNRGIFRTLEKNVSSAKIYYADSIESAKLILDKQQINMIICDVLYKAHSRRNVLNIEDINSEGMDFFKYSSANTEIPVFILESKRLLNEEERISLERNGAKGEINLNDDKEEINSKIKNIILGIHINRCILELARANKIITYKTMQRLCSPNSAEICLYDFCRSTAVEADDNDKIVSDISKPDVRFENVIGAEEAKKELKYFINYLKNPKEYLKRGVKQPRGILLYGSPGTGKTMLAKAMAGESDVTFIAAEGNQFLKKCVGEGPESVHQLFAIARKYAPSILFIDEIDAIAKDRQNYYAQSGSDVLTAFLTEMDGFKTDRTRPVFVLAATNYNIDKDDRDSLDPALLRRFDRRIFVELPNKNERKQFINTRLTGIEHSVTDVEVENLAIRSTGASLAELDSVFELAMRNLIKDEKGILTDEILEDAFETFNNGEIKKWDKSELIRTARHEAGHTVICYLTGEKPSYVTIVARGNHGGYMQHDVNENKGTYTKQELIDRIRIAMGGRAAEIVYYGEYDGLSSGASGDIQNATEIAKTMICSYAMDEKIGLYSINASEMTNSAFYGNVLNSIDEILKTELKKAISVLEQNKNAVDLLVDKLLEKNSLTGEQISEILSSALKK